MQARGDPKHTSRPIQPTGMPVTGSFQHFDDPVAGGRDPQRIDILRSEVARRGIRGFIVPRADEHQSEYTPAHAERLAWLTGFTGSAGTAIILDDAAALFTDGRYMLQAPGQIDTSRINVVNGTRVSMGEWLSERLRPGDGIGFDPWLHTAASIARLRNKLESIGARLVPQTDNPVDLIWQDQPAPPAAPAYLHPLDFAGEDTPAKLARVQAALEKERIGGLIVSDPHNLCWIFNLRGGDVPHTPIMHGYAIILGEGRPHLFIAPQKLGAATHGALTELAEIAEPGSLLTMLDRLAAQGIRLRLDQETGADALRARIEAAGGVADIGADPVTLMKAQKNRVEIGGSRKAHLRDAAAMSRFLAWFADVAPAGELTEIDAAQRLEAFRAESNALMDISFPTIAGAGEHGAIVHYRVSHESNRQITIGDMFLIDSGAQYRDGTTDITRTLFVGEPTPEMRAHYTRVLKGHIAISRAVFPKGTTGAQIDALARLPLWEAGLDFDHGTGHGVGSFLSVHEGPQRISKTGTVALEAGMILSNEPGYYKAQAYGIRIENLLLVEEREIAGGEREMLGFETLTLAPYERKLIEPALLDRTERAWIDAYHAQVFEKLALIVDDATRLWLEGATRPLQD